MIKPKRMRLVGYVARMTARMNAYKALVRKPQGKWPLERCRHMWKGSIEIDLRKTGRGGADPINLAQHRDQWRAVVNAVMNLRVP
jgi:hypothetical protein